MTNQETAVREFADEQGPVVFKAIMHKLLGEEDTAKLIYTTPVTIADLDDRVEAERCHDCLTALDLRFGLFDFSVTPDGRWWYLEVNPGGRWAWLQAETGLPMAAAIATELTGAHL